MVQIRVAVDDPTRAYGLIRRLVVLFRSVIDFLRLCGGPMSAQAVGRGKPR
jgi:hypothetical protein